MHMACHDMHVHPIMRKQDIHNQKDIQYGKSGKARYCQIKEHVQSTVKANTK
jgi:hypothetical protein